MFGAKRSLSLLVTLVSIFLTTNALPSQERVNALSAPSRDLRSWLQELVLPLPFFEIPAITGSIVPAINVTGGNCSKLLLNNIAVVNQSNATAMKTRLDIQDFNIKCAVEMVFDLYGGPLNVVASVKIEHMNLSMGLAIAHDDGKPPLPTVFGLSHTANGSTDCSIQPGLNLSLTSPDDPTYQPILDVMISQILPLINDLGNTICPKVDDILRNNVTNFVAGLSPILHMIMVPQPTKPAPVLPAVPGGDFFLNETQAGAVFLAMLHDTLHYDDVGKMNVKLRKLAGGLLDPMAHNKALTVIDNSVFKFGLSVDGDVMIDLDRINKLNIAAQNTTFGLAVALKALAIGFNGSLQFEANPVGLPVSKYQCDIKKAAINVSDMQVLMDMSVGVEQRKFSALAFDQLLTKAGLQNMVTYNEDGQLYNEGLEILGLTLNITPGLDLELGKSGLEESDLAPLEEMLVSSIDTLVWALLDVYGGSVRSLLNGALGFFGTAKLNNLLATATKDPAPVKDSRLDEGTWKAYMNSPLLPALPIGFACISLALVGAGFGKSLVKKSGTQRQEPLARSYTERQSAERQPETSIIMSGAVSRLTAFGIIALLLVNLFLFIPASSGRGTSLYVNLTQDGKTTSSPAIHWSLASSFHQMMNAHAYVLGWLVFIASGIWPYTKLMFLFGAMVVPPTKLAGIGVRQNILVLVDAVGKFSLLDSFFMFLYEALISARWENVDGSRKLSVSIEPDAGFILFFSATILCLIMGHIVLILHRLSMHQDRPEAGSRGESFSLHKTAPRWLQIAIPPMLLVSIVLWPFGLFMTSLHTKVTGGLGVFYNLVDMDPVLDVSIFFVVSGPWRVLGYHTWVQLGWRLILTGLSMLFVVILPAVFCISLFVLWFTPLRRKGRFAGIALVQCVRAWAAMDICAFTMLVAWGFGPPFFRSFTSDPSQAFAGICSGIKSSLGANCFNLEATPEIGLVLAVIQSVVVLVASVFISAQADKWLQVDGACEASLLIASSVHRSGLEEGIPQEAQA